MICTSRVFHRLIVIHCQLRKYLIVRVLMDIFWGTVAEFCPFTRIVFQSVPLYVFSIQ